MMPKPVPRAGASAAQRKGRRAVAALALLVPLSFPAALSGQSWIQDFVITAGLTGEAWWGDFSAITVPQFDSTENAIAGVGEWSARGVFRLFNGSERRLEAILDGGIRQSAAGGFQLRNYAPREQSGSVSMEYTDAFGGGSFTSEATARIRRVFDHPPMPLYKPPGYDIFSARARYARSVRGTLVDLNVAGEQADYAPPVLEHLDFLDRNSVTIEAGGSRRFDIDEELGDYWALRLYGAYGYHSYPRQGGEVQRVDNAMRLGFNFRLLWDRLEFSATLDGTRSRSTSRRVEYNRGRVDAQAIWLLTEDMDLVLTGTLARKRYIKPGQHALVPGEEADNATIVYAELTRALASRVDGAFRIGWGKVETNFTGAFYTRFRGGFSLRVRPWRR